MAHSNFFLQQKEIQKQLTTKLIVKLIGLNPVSDDDNNNLKIALDFCLANFKDPASPKLDDEKIREMMDG